jgi:maleylacetoacetate isomerase
MKLYGYFRSSAAFRTRIALNLKGLEYEQVSLVLRRGDQRQPDYLEKNPLGLVPTLEEEGQFLIQSLAIIEYLDETHPEPPFLPGHPADRARVRGLAYAVACDIHPIDNLRVLKYLSKPLGQDDKAIEAWFNHWITLGFEGMERIMARDGQTGEFCHGDEPSLADICLVPQVFNSMRYDLDLGAYPTIRRVFENCMKLEAFDKARPEKQPDAE